jgi:hypothetical protein
MCLGTEGNVGRSSNSSLITGPFEGVVGKEGNCGDLAEGG